MAASAKTLLVGAAIALAVALFTMQAARAGGYHAVPSVPFAPFNAYAPAFGDDDHDDDVAILRRVPRIDPDIEGAVATAHGIARELLDGDDDYDRPGSFFDLDD